MLRINKVLLYQYTKKYREQREFLDNQMVEDIRKQYEPILKQKRTYSQAMVDGEEENLEPAKIM